MAYNKSSENSKQSSSGQTRKTMLFNERTDRSLNAELNQLERSRNEVKRDLRKIQQVKDVLNDRLLSVLDRRPKARSVSDVSSKAPSEGNTSRNLFPRISSSNNLIQPKRPRHNSDPVSYNNANRSRKISNDHSNALYTDDSIIDDEDKFHRGRDSPPLYITNQQRREDLIIKSRFNQLGSRFVGVEIMTKRRKSISRMTSRGGNFNDANLDAKMLSQTNGEAVLENQSEFRSNVEVDANETGGLNSDFAGMTVTSQTQQNLSSGNYSNLQTDTKRIKFPSGTSVIEDPLKSMFSKENSRDRQTSTKPQRKLSSSTVSSGTLQRKISTGSMGVFDQDTAARLRPEGPLPKIPLELTSTRQSKTGSCMEQAFLTCQQLNSDHKDDKKERKRRFASLVSAVIKQGKVIKAWEPLLAQFGDIDSSDDEPHSQ